MELLVLFFGIFFITAIVLLGRWVLGPIDRAARVRQAPVRYSLADFLCLFVIIQIPLAAAYQLTDEEARPLYWALTIITWIAGPLIWFTATRALSKAEIVGVHRLAFMALIVPLAYYGLIPFAIITIWLAGRVFDDEPSSMADVWLFAVWLGLGVSLWLGGWYTHWMVRRVDDQHELRQVEDSETQTGLSSV